MPASVDLLIVGAGIYGATAAHAASRRGRSVLLLDRGDLGGGASSNSLKVAHGGLRYLQSLDLRRSLESVRERRRLMRLAPGLVRPLQMQLDLSERGAAYGLLLRGGLLANDLVSWRRNRGVAPAAHLPGSAYPRWHDALIHDTERLLLGFVHSACAANPGGIDVRTYTTVEAWEERAGRVVGARLSDGSRVQTRAVLRCPGATRPGQEVVLAMNLVVDALPLTDAGAVGLAHPDDGRNVFAVPWRGQTMLGTYYREHPYDPCQPVRIERTWIEELLAWLRPVHPALAQLAPAAVRLVHAGLLPRASSPDPDPSDLDRVEDLPDGSVDVQGVKWTTAYGVAERAVVQALRRSGLTADAESALRPLQGLEPGCLDDAAPALTEPLLPGRCPVPRGQLVFAVRREWARGLADVLLRRTGIAAAGHPGRDVSAATARVLQEALDWSEREMREEIEAFDDDPRFAGNVAREAG